MLRISLQRSRVLAAGAISPRSGSQWLATRSRYAVGGTQRYFADGKKTDETVMPGSNSAKASGDVPPPPTLRTSPANPLEKQTISAQDVPKMPPAPSDASTASSNPTKPPSSVPTGTGSASVAPPPGTPSAPPPKPKRRFRRFLTSVFILSILGYGLGVYYARVSDNWHDFFTEYVPFGEDAVGYFEEREFRKRFPDGTLPRLHEQVRGEKKVTIPSRSGTSWRVVGDEGGSGNDLGAKGRHTSALDDSHVEKPAPKPASNPSTGADKSRAVQDAKKESPKDSHTHALLPKPAEAKKPASAAETKPKDEATKPEPPKATAAPSTPPPASAPAASIALLSVQGATEPVVQDVVNTMNELITVINADGAAGRYASAMAKAKGDLTKAIDDINAIKETEKKSAEDKIRNSHIEFDTAAKELVRRLEAEMQNQEAHWKDEYESEREKLSQAYQNKLKSELDSKQKVYEQKVQNELLQQAIALRREFAESVRERVEGERAGRLSKLNELSSSVQELEQLTGEWNDVVDANLKTQHLLVAVEAVRANLENADRPKPFIEELAALKEVAADSSLVNAAIASINPTAYQRGIPTSSQLIDRFRRVAAEVRKAALLPENAGVASHIASLALSKVMFRKEGLPVGDDVESVLTRTEMLLEEGNLDDAAREMNGLKGWAGTLSKDWLGECRRVLEVRQAMDVIATEARLQSLLVD